MTNQLAGFPAPIQCGLRNERWPCSTDELMILVVVYGSAMSTRKYSHLSISSRSGREARSVEPR